MKPCPKFFQVLFLAVIGGLSWPPCRASDPLSASRPNVIIMMLDDLGFSDLGCYGSEIETPRLDGLAKEGLRFRQFYNTAKCHSSRVSLLTGLYCNQAGSEKLSHGVTIAEVLKRAGYRTAMTGKWHLDGQPTDRGFEKFFGHLSGAINYFKGDDTYRLNGNPWSGFGDEFYSTDANIAYATRFMDEMRKESPDQPFFLYIAHNAPHYPFHVREEDYRKYEGRYNEGWDEIRRKRFQKQKDEGVVPANCRISPRPTHVPAWESMKRDERELESRKMTAFAGIVDRIDQTTGILLDYLEKNGLQENTLLMICSDNGACPFDRSKGLQYEPWDPRSYWCYDTGWSHVGNTPFRLHKQNQHQGGNSSPLIISWPGKLKTQPGEVTEQPAHLIDFMATALDLAGATYPDSWPGVDLQALEGRSLVPIFEGKVREPHPQLYFQFSTNRALREGDWKLVSHRLGRWELYNLREDPTELNDLAAQHEDRVEQMSAAWSRIAVEKERLKGKLVEPTGQAPGPELLKNGTPARKK